MNKMTYFLDSFIFNMNINIKKYFQALIITFSDLDSISSFLLDKYFIKNSKIIKIAPNIEVELVATARTI